MFEKYLEEVSKTSLFQGIERVDILAMLNCLKPRVCSYNRNDYIVTGGDPYESVGIVLKGAATVSKENAEGNRIVMTLLKQGDIFGEIIAFSSQMNWPATVQAQETCVVLFLPRGKIVGECDRMCSWHRTLIQNFLRVISERAMMLNKKVEYLTIKSMRGKISTYLLEQYRREGDVNITLPLNRNELSDFLNVSRPSMSREMSKMKDEGIIDFHLTAVKIRNIEGLKHMSAL
ncbi:Crp/Fnr family transcriptional regulator [Desulfosporosinus metallidurans]|uniref:Hcp transcriptional regulator HcpR (Crp/Fnr family) n=1 Tax=Desulfosporosinus metallidurans TaxID=1888891 RepID=A0A1Q8QM69_9FIRM|nr:Crp/Fnr family transcriptional regulator [Desulfosporosinus metallidurans]OLN28429.1 Hcp transcriptional regulator HcpR (Crp/Fnr family) [Desulfosporosinus metallidurans]